MSHPDPRYDPENSRKEDSHWSRKSSKGKALMSKVKGFGSEYPGKKGIKKLLKKSISHRIKHF